MFAWIAGLVAAVMAGVVVERFRSRPRVVWYTLPRASFVLSLETKNPVPVHAEILVVQNLGNASAEDVEVTLLIPPQPGCLSVAPPRAFQTEPVSGGQYLMKLGSLAPREWINIQVLYNAVTPTVTNVRAKNALVAPRQIIISPRLPQAAYLGMLLLMTVGAIVVLAGVIWGAQIAIDVASDLLQPPSASIPASGQAAVSSGAYSR
ncbi:MAG: hypothetical protein K2P70_04210 [Hyphomonadaceae bacterium]|nr:hypothetical protein [Hyphomonadaceae bacterium]